MGQTLDVARRASVMKCNPCVGLDLGTGIKLFRLGDGFQSNLKKLKNTILLYSTYKKCKHHFSVNKYYKGGRTTNKIHFSYGELYGTMCSGLTTILKDHSYTV
jgi:hypothetical protein